MSNLWRWNATWKFSLRGVRAQGTPEDQEEVSQVRGEG